MRRSTRPILDLGNAIRFALAEEDPELVDGFDEEEDAEQLRQIQDYFG